MKNNILFIFLILFVLGSCTKDDDPSGGGDNNKETQKLTNNDFGSDLVLEDRNNGVDYFIESVINVSQSLTIKPGVVIEFAEGAGLDVSSAGSLEAIGLPTSPITFTGKIKAKGAWKGIIIETSSLRNKFKHCIFEFGGGEDWGNGIQGGLTSWADAALNIDDCTFKSNKSRGVNLYHNSRVDLRSFENNKFENNDTPILLDPSTVHQMGTTNTYADADNRIHVYENNMFEDEGKTNTWRSQGIPYFIHGRIDVSGNNNFTVNEGVTLEFAEIGYIDIGDKASFTTKGSAQNPVILTGETKVPGSWGGIAISFTTSSKNVLENTIIEYAGGNISEFSNGIFYMWADPTLTVKNCTFRNNKSCIFNARPSNSKINLTESGNTVTNSGALFCQ